jgi:hypothetical protein
MVRSWVVSPRASVPPRHHIRHQLLQCIVTGGSAVSAVSCCDVLHSRSVRDPHGRARATGAVEGEGTRAPSADVSVWSLRTPEGSSIINRSSVIFVPMIGATYIWNSFLARFSPWNATVSAWPRSCHSCGGMSAG